MKFPVKKYKNIQEYAADYLLEKNNCLKKVNFENLKQASDILCMTYKKGKSLFVCGNGGSASITNHFVQDHLKTISSDTSILPRVFSLSNSIEIISAVANDISYDEIFSYQLNSLSKENDVLLVISSSGNSKNILKAIETGLNKKLKILSFTGFDGGKAKKLAHLNIHVDSMNYGVIEDIHQTLMHILAQYIRHKFMNKDLIVKNNF